MSARRSSGILALAVAAYLGLTVPLAALLNVWVDEAFSLETTGGGIALAIRRALDFELQPPLYFALLAAWRALGATDLFARLFSVLCGLGVVLLVPALARRYAGRSAETPLLLVVALHPFLVWAALEIRPYAFVLLLSALLLLSFHDAFLRDGVSWKLPVAYAVVAACALYTQYYLGFLLAAQWLSLGALARGRALRNATVALGAAGLAFLPIAVRVGTHAAQHVGAGPEGDTPLGALREVSWRIFGFLDPLDGSPAWLFTGLHIAMVAGAGFVAWRWRRHWDRPALALLIQTGLLALAFAVVVARLGPTLVGRRHVSALFLPTLLLLVAVLQRPGGRTTRALNVLWVTGALVLAAVTLVRTYAPLSKPPDLREVARIIEREESPGQPILIFNAQLELPLRRYYRGRNRLVALPRPEDFARYDLREYALTDTAQIDEALAAAGSAAGPIWLVTGESCGYLGIDFRCDLLERWVAERFTPDSTRELRRVRLRRIVPRPGAAEISP